MKHEPNRTILCSWRTSSSYILNYSLPSFCFEGCGVRGWAMRRVDRLIEKSLYFRVTDPTELGPWI